ncbi:MAG: phosphoribosyl-ATP diphosphatase [Deltaproteobacteria bacterium]|nr:phosphoribosyl-ATP diphosphatase [Deltaproteobacteria bacterium]TLN02826.1 MAG: phosphoribosyl-ATP diphosphatase [bacterium]
MSSAGKTTAGQGERSAILELLFQVIQERKNGSAEKSYTVSLFQKGLDTILKKTGEEAVELVIAGKGGKREEIVYEAADLLYHLLVLLSYYDIDPEEIYSELRRRFGLSGIAEKESRGS